MDKVQLERHSSNASCVVKCNRHHSWKKALLITYSDSRQATCTQTASVTLCQPAQYCFGYRLLAADGLHLPHKCAGTYVLVCASLSCYTSQNSPCALPLNRGSWRIFEQCQVRPSFGRFPQPILTDARRVPKIDDPGAARGLRCTGLGQSLAGTAGSNPASGTVVCLLWMLRFARQRPLRRVYPSTRGVLPSVMCLCNREPSVMRRAFVH